MPRKSELKISIETNRTNAYIRAHTHTIIFCPKAILLIQNRKNERGRARKRKRKVFLSFVLSDDFLVSI